MEEPSFPLPGYIRPDDIVSLLIKADETGIRGRQRQVIHPAWRGRGTRKGSFERRERVRSTAAVPLLVGDEPVGASFVNF